MIINFEMMILRMMNMTLFILNRGLVKSYLLSPDNFYDDMKDDE